MAVLIIFVVGAVAGAVIAAMLVVSSGIRREERAFSLTRQAPGRTSEGARLLTGLYVRQRSDVPQLVDQRPDLYV